MNARVLATVLTSSLACGTVLFADPLLRQKSATKQAKPQAPLERQTLPKGLLQLLRLDLEDLEEDEFENARLWLALQDLNGDGVKEYVIVGFCAAVGNCALWVVKKEATEYRVLLRNADAQTVCVRSTKAKGFLDLETQTHGSAFDRTVALYRFNGKEYEMTDGYALRWEMDDETRIARQVEGPKNSPKCKKLTFSPVRSQESGDMN